MLFFFVFVFSIFLVSLQSQATNLVADASTTRVSEINANLFSSLYDFVFYLGRSFHDALVSLHDFISVGEWTLLALHAPHTRDLIMKQGLQLLLTFLISGILAQGISLLLKRKINALLDSKNSTSLKKIINLGKSVILTTLIPLSFGIFFYTLSRTLSPDHATYLAIVRVLSSGLVTIWICLNVSHLFLRPPTPAHQHIPAPKEALTLTYLWIRRTALFALLGFFALRIGDFIDLPLSGHILLLRGTALIITLLMIVTGTSLFREIQSWITVQYKNPKLSSFKRAMLPYLSYSYIPFVIFVVASYMSWTARFSDEFVAVLWKGLFTAALFPIARALSVCFRKLRIYYLYKYLKLTSRPLERYFLSHTRKVDLLSLGLFNVLACFIALKIWHLDPTDILMSAIGRLVVERVVSICLIFFIALIITRAGQRVLTKYLTTPEENKNAAQKQKMARFKTIHSVSRSLLLIAVWAPATILIVIELNINVVPLLTTVGIFSVGLSFGVQSLVKDFVTGFFMLLEDAFAVGDLVIVNGQIGRVESLTVRVVRVRSLDGALHTFPYGSISGLSNKSRDYSALVLLFNVGRNADLKKVFDILEKISADLSQDPSVKKLINGSIRIDGVNAVSDHTLEVRAFLRTQPAEYEQVRWAFNRLLSHYLQEEKIPQAIPREITYLYPIEKEENFF